MSDSENQQAPQLPEKPLPSDCCGGGCSRCVYDVYADEMEAYEARRADWLARQSKPGAGKPTAEGLL